MLAWPEKRAPSLTTRAFDRIVPSTRPPSATSVMVRAVILPLSVPPATTFWAWMSASTWLWDERITSTRAAIFPFARPSIRIDSVDTSVPSN